MLRDPRAGDNISADWARELVREIRRNRPIQGENTRVVVTPNGTVIHGTPGGRGSSAASAPGRFAIFEAVREDGSKGFWLKNCYYRVGGRTYAMSETPVPLGNPPDGIIALHVNAIDSTPGAIISHYSSLDALQLSEANVGSYVVPLYLLKNGKVICDFRIGPDCAMGEF